MNKFTLFLMTGLCCVAIATAAAIASTKGKEEGRSLARIDATLKSYLGNPLTGLVYAASLAIGAISILSMYESPLSPLPVPSLPKPPVGRFPPENPIWPPVAKQPVKLRHSSSPYAASAMSPVYSLAPPKASSQEDNSWLEGQNLVQNYQNFLQSQGGQQILAAAAAAANSGASLGGSRRQDQLQQAHLQSYINQMSKVPSIRFKSNGQAGETTSPQQVSHSPAAHPVKHSISSTVSEGNSSGASASSSSSLSSSSSPSASPSSPSSSAAVPADTMQDYSSAAAAAAAAA